MIATRHLRRADPVMARIIERVGPCTFVPRVEGTHFDAIVRAIVYQQLSGKAAATIHRRVRELYGDRDPTPAELLATPDEPLRAAGLSRQKLGYLRDLAARATADVDFDPLHELEDAAIVEALTSVKGVGRWTAQMFLMFRLGRPDVLPDLDLGIQNAIQRAYGLEQRPSPKQVLEIGTRWSPHATIASWYLWRSLELPDEGGVKARTQKAAKAARKSVKAVKKTARKAVSAVTRGTRKAAKTAKRAAKSGVERVAGKGGRSSGRGTR